MKASILARFVEIIVHSPLGSYQTTNKYHFPCLNK